MSTLQKKLDIGKLQRKRLAVWNCFKCHCYWKSIHILNSVLWLCWFGDRTWASGW